MAKYKNYLVREAEAKKAERRNAMPKKTVQTKLSEMQKVFVDLKRIADDNSLSNEEKATKFMEVQDQMDGKLQELGKRKENIRKEIEGRGENANSEIIAKLEKESRRIDRQITVLQDFPKKRTQIFKIMNIAKGFEVKREESREKANKDLEEAKAKVDRIKQIDIELKEIDDFDKRLYEKDGLTEDDKKQSIENSIKYNKLLAEKEGINTQELEEKLKQAKAKVREYETGKSKEDSALNKCNMAWRMLAEGKTWDEIELAQVQTSKAIEPKATEPKVVEPKAAEPKAVEPNATEPKAVESNAVEPNAVELQPELDPETAEEIKKTVEKGKNESELPTTVEPEESEDKNKFKKLISRIQSFGKKVADKFNTMVEKIKKSRESDDSKEVNENNDSNVSTGLKVTKVKKQQEEKSDSKATLKEQRDVFTTYLRDMVEKGEHTEPGKYATASKQQEHDEQEH